MSDADRDCRLCGSDTKRLCWCHDPSAMDGRWCRCNPRVAVSPATELYLDDDGTVRTWEVGSWRETRLLRLDVPVTVLAAVAGGIVVGTTDGHLVVDLHEPGSPGEAQT